MSTHPTQWHAPLPLWGRLGDSAEAAAAGGPDQFRPALLRFASDDFMEQLIGLLARDPSRLGELLAWPETWRSPGPTPGTDSAPLAETVPLPSSVEARLRSRAPTRPTRSVAPSPAKRQVVEQTQPRTLPLKLYQPAHQRHYLVAASLVCGVPGLPERRVTPGGSQRVGFVLRRLLPASGATGDTSEAEFAYIEGSGGARWQRVADAAADSAGLAPGEVQLPLFPLTFRDELEHSRVLWAGLLPVAKREDYVAAPIDRKPVPLLQGQFAALQASAPAATTPGIRRRLMQFKTEVAEPWKALVRSAATARDSMAEAPADGMPSAGASPTERNARRLKLNLQWQMQSWLILLDLADYIAAHLPRLSAAIDSPVAASQLSAEERRLYDWFGDTAMSAELRHALKPNPINSAPDLRTPASSLRDALRLVRATSARERLESTTASYAASSAADAWPGFHFLLVGLDSGGGLAGAWANLGALPSATASDDVIDAPDPGVSGALPPGQFEAGAVDRLSTAVAAALTPDEEAGAPPLAQAVTLARTLAGTANATPWFVVRCIYLDRDCGPLHPPLASAASQRFQLANFFDADAPARPIRITLPTDTTPAGLRKHSKNTAFVISDVLCGQIQRAKGLGLVDLVRSVLPWPLHKDLDVGEGGPCGGGAQIGMICSLSIPIITICALILLLIIVTLLDAIFYWLPYLVFCVPVLRLAGKSREKP